MTCHYSDLSNAFDWLKNNLLQPIRITTQIRVVTSHQYVIFLRPFLRRHFLGKPVMVWLDNCYFLRLNGACELGLLFERGKQAARDAPAAKPREAKERRVLLSLPRPPLSRLLWRASRASTFPDIPKWRACSLAYSSVHK